MDRIVLPPGRTLAMTWQRLVSDGGATCPRCGSTGEAVREARHALADALAPLGIAVVLDERTLDDAAFRADPSQSNRVWLRCPLPSTDACDGVQSMTCSKATRRLIPIWRTSPIYNVLRAQLGLLEHVHEDWRTWFRSGGKSLRERQRRMGLACQQLRASAALLIERVWVLLRQGWIGRRRTERAVAVPLGDKGRFASLMRRRRKGFLLGGGYAAGKAPPGALAAA